MAQYLRVSETDAIFLERQLIHLVGDSLPTFTGLVVKQFHQRVRPCIYHDVKGVPIPVVALTAGLLDFNRKR